MYAALQTAAWPLGYGVEILCTKKHAVQGSNLPTPDLEAGVPPLGLTTCVMRRVGLEPTRATRDRPGYGRMQSPLCHLRFKQNESAKTED